jgi:hypothetical protein
VLRLHVDGVVKLIKRNEGLEMSAEIGGKWREKNCESMREVNSGGKLLEKISKCEIF